MKTFKVVTRTGHSWVFVGAGLGEVVREQIAKLGAERVLLLADAVVTRLHRGWIDAAVPDGPKMLRMDLDVDEGRKTISEASKILEAMAASGFRRSDAVVTLGGGVVSDLGGFVASVYGRGMPVIHVPTTLLGQVDAAIGGKTAVNLPAAKNLVGTFHQPAAVVADVELLSSLPEEEWRSGMAEVVKYGLAFAPEVLKDLPRQPEAGSRGDAIVDMVAVCAGTKAEVVSSDERDEGKRLFLNYGHTLGHALEAASGYASRHGYAISVGMFFAAHLAVRLGIAKPELVLQHEEALAAQGLPTSADFDIDAVTRAWDLDKKNLAGQRWVLLEELGTATVREDVPMSLALEVLSSVRRS